MPLAARHLLTGIITTRPPFSVVFTLWLSMIAALGEVCRPSAFRTLSRTLSQFKSIPNLTEGQSKKKYKREVGILFVEPLAGFLNARGGTLLIGVDDDGLATGIDYSTFDERKPTHDGFALYLRNLLTDRLGGAASSHLTIRFHEVDGHDICEVAVEPSDRPIYIDDHGKTEFFLRAGNSTRKLPVDEAVKYVQSRFKDT